MEIGFFDAEMLYFIKLTRLTIQGVSRKWTPENVCLVPIWTLLKLAKFLENDAFIGLRKSIRVWDFL